MTYSQMELAEVFIKTGELADALIAINQLLSDNPNDDVARRLRASVLLRMGSNTDLEKALKDLDDLTEKLLEDYIQQSIIFERLNRTDEAIHAMQTAHQKDPHSERILERLVELLTDNHHYTSALSILEKVPQTWRWLMRQADIHTRNNHPEKALVALNSAEAHLLTIFPDLLSPVSRNTMAQIHIARGQVQMKLNQLKSAEADLQDALYYIPDDVTILFNLGLIYALRGNLTRAKNYCKKALDNASDFIRQTLLDVLNTDERYSDIKKSLGL